MLGLMMDQPLRIIDLLQFASDVHGHAQIVSATLEGGTHRTCYRDIFKRVGQLANALARLGVKQGDRVATLAWNGYRHFELYYAVSGIGAICHTINPRLSTEQLIYIINHAEDRVLFTDVTFVPLLKKIRQLLPKNLQIVILSDQDHLLQSNLTALPCYEALLAEESRLYDWPIFNEHSAASLCYSSGTTGDPKGTLYSHRSTVLHALIAASTFHTCLRPGQHILPVVPMFHVNAWGVPYAAPLTGASIIFSGAQLDGASLFDLMDKERVFSAWGVPTVWLGLLAEIEKRGMLPASFGEVIVGGSAAPRSMIEAFETRGVSVIHAWGMTEMSPLGTQGVLTPGQEKLPLKERLDLKSKQGRRVFGVSLKIIDETGQALPHDGKAQGELLVQGNTIARAYFNNAPASRAAFDDEGWFKTGDVAKIDAEGSLIITDRAKDLIKSGGEWISSIDVENQAMSHPDIANCAVIALPHPKWDERPVLIVTLTEGRTLNAPSIMEHMSQTLAKWQLPDEILTIDALPLTATGKVSKLRLRELFKDHVLPDLRDHQSA